MGMRREVPQSRRGRRHSNHLFAFVPVPSVDRDGERGTCETHLKRWSGRVIGDVAELLDLLLIAVSRRSGRPSIPRRPRVGGWEVATEGT